ncbi:T9SS type A sorting domain-containing protein [Aquimarina gracilis]|uniref:T9SS type A sorting domain-containing protein n=1 Tax=Aquimarina gracilis TaxID=874422 RepID=A0ABU5ZZ37_9FLAO|nr:T9SS type A sorting domain-containing protein [Aquimarina gracilis]MEB3347117.1 T9SS type A sorting domain-containing protein [Aquimarina gracilis]
MKTFLFYSKRLVWGIVLLGTITLNAQQRTNGLTDSSGEQLPSKPQGHKLYKQSKLFDNTPKIKRPGEDIEARMEYEFQRLRDPNTGKIPSGINDAELEFSSRIPEGNDSKKSLSVAAKSAKSSKSSRFSYWQNRGPFNVGGRTRALAIDRTNENIILAGGVSGGLWRSIDAGQSWRKVTNRRQSPSITTIVQDPRPGRHNTWYYGSGEFRGNSAGAGGAFFAGTGVYKSVNGGRTWRLLESTNDGDVNSISPFDIINSIAIHPVSGDLYVATLNGIHRSQDGGNSFQEVLAGGPDNITEINITTTGQIYATIELSGDPNAGFFTSTDGNEWTSITPATIPPAFGRTVMGIDPSNESIVYFFSHILGTSSAFLFKYDADAATPEEMWIDLSANLPTTIGGRVGNLNLQGNYNMVVKVSPADPNLVFVGGTNLYRSTTGFTTPAGQESWVGGYSPLNDVSVYPDQHPDQHVLLFYPSNPNKALTGSDGGVAVTEDITTTLSPEEPVDWVSLNNGYLTTQPYHVSFDPEANSDDLLAGFQDNGTWYTNSTDPTTPWTEDFGGDGSYSAFADGGRTRYVSSQGGNLYRLNFDETGAFESFTRVRPTRVDGLAFIAPFVLDPNNDNIMYLPGGRTIWRNNNLDEIPLFSNATTSVNWVGLQTSQIPISEDPTITSRITALDVSQYPVANRLYYGSNVGGIYRMDNANLDGQEAIDISAGKGLPAGFVNDINVDASNADRVIVTFSNYGIISLYLTEDGGETWTNISGNLEENADGTGNGPSVRSTAFLGGSQGFLGSRTQRVFAATSTGLYYATRLNGERTRWIKEPFAIGNAVTDEVRTRKDGFIAVAAHGNGLYSARFPVFNDIPELSLSVAYGLDNLTFPQDSEDVTIDITGLFVSSQGASIDIEVVNGNSDLVSASLEEDSLTLSFGEGMIGSSTINLIATAGGEQVSAGFNVLVFREGAIYEQTEPVITDVPSQSFLDFGGALAQIADDFVVPENTQWTIDQILAFGAKRNAPTLDNATAIIYSDNDGAPGEEVYNSGSISSVYGTSNPDLNLVFPEAVTLESGKYWLSIYATLNFRPDATQWYWQAQSGGVGQEPQFRDNFNLFGTGAVDWTPVSLSLGRPPTDQIFQIFGSVENSESTKQLLATLNKSSVNTFVAPNPSSGKFVFSFNGIDSQGDLSINIYDISGKLVYAKSNIDKNFNFEWDSSANQSGFYFAKIRGKDFARNVKLVKR